MSVIQSCEVKVADRRAYHINVERFDNAQEVVKTCSEREITNGSFYDMRTHEIRQSWHGVKSYNEALELLSGGYQPTVEKFQSALKMNGAGTAKRIKFRNDVQGFAPVVPLALMGVPNSMVNMQVKQIKCKVVDIYYDMTSSSGTSTEEIIQNGQKLLGVVCELEMQGYRFNLYAIQSYSSGTDSDMLCVKVKSSDRPLDLKRISFPLTHPAFFRVIGFDWYSKCPVAKYRGAYGHGIGYEFNRRQLEEMAAQLFGDNAVYFSSSEMLSVGEDHLKEVLTNVGKKR